MGTVVLGRQMTTYLQPLEEDGIRGDRAGALDPLWASGLPLAKGAGSESIHTGGSWSGTRKVFRTWPGHVES